MMRREHALNLGTLLLALAFAMNARAAAPADTQPAVPPPSDAADRDREDLIRELKGDTADAGVFERVLTNMQRSQDRLTVDFDPGAETQRIQAQILKDIDEAMELARKQNAGGQKSQQRVEARKAGRRMDPKQQQAKAEQAKNATGDAPTTANGAVNDPGAEGDLKEGGRGWGHLPERDREAVIQGLQDKHRQKYDDLIQKYYESLAQPKHDE